MRPVQVLCAALCLSLAAAAGCGGPTDGNTDTAADLAEDPARSATPAAPAYTVWDTAPHPESVTIDGGVVYVTHFGDALEPSTQDGDGYVARYDANGTLVDTFATGLDAPKGSLVLGKTYYVADVDSLLGFSTRDGSRVQAFSFTGETEYLNGLAAGPNNELFASATDAGKIWRVEPASGKITPFAELVGANGLAYDAAAGALYAVAFDQSDPSAGHVYRYDLGDPEPRKVSDYGGMLDGVAVVDGGAGLVFTDWNAAGGGTGRVVYLDVANGQTAILAEDALFSGPADFDVMGDGLAMIPMLTGGRVVAVRLERPAAAE